MKLYVLHSQCKTEINPSFFLEEPDTVSCKVIGNVASAGLQLSSCWQGRQTAQLKGNIYFNLPLGLPPLKRTDKFEMSGVHELQSLHQFHHSVGIIYIWVKKLSLQMGHILTPLLLTCLETLDHWEIETWILPFPWLAACSTQRWVSALSPSQKQWVFHGITRSAYPVLTLRHSRL